MNKREWVESAVQDQEKGETLTADGFDDAIIGMDFASMRVIYSVDKCIQLVMEWGMSQEDAVDYFEFNMRGAYMGPGTPIWCDDVPPEVGPGPEEGEGRMKNEEVYRTLETHDLRHGVLCATDGSQGRP